MPPKERERPKQVAKERKPIKQIATVAIAEHDAEVRFHIRAARGRGKSARGIELLKKAASTGK